MDKIKDVSFVLKIIVCIAFMLCSFFCCLLSSEEAPEKTHDVNSNELILKTIEEENVRREVYVDTAGIATFAKDKHYASVVKNLDEKGHVLSEFYYDEYGMPVAMPAGQYGILREYDKHGHEIRMTYVDAEGEPKRITTGYVSVLKEYDENGNEVKNTYVDWNLEPVYRNEGYAGWQKEYDENGGCSRIIYLDSDGEPINNVVGIAVEERALDEKERVQTVMYFDMSGKPTANTLGQYGETYIYDEQERRYKTIYLDEEGNASSNNYGYAILKKIYKTDDIADVEMYFDKDDRPVRLAHGEYGIRRENGRRFYLTKSGKINYFLSIDEYLHENALLTILVGITLCFLGVFLPKPMQIVLLVLYAGFIIYMTLLYRTGGEPEGQFELFWSYKAFFSDYSMRVELFQNIWLFVPLGAIMYIVLQKRWILLISLSLSIVIEVIQYYTGRGLFEFDDIISNGLGGCLGLWIGQLTINIKNNIQNHKLIAWRVKNNN